MTELEKIADSMRRVAEERPLDALSLSGNISEFSQRFSVEGHEVSALLVLGVLGIRKVWCLQLRENLPDELVEKLVLLFLGVDPSTNKPDYAELKSKSGVRKFIKEYRDDETAEDSSRDD